MVELAFAAKITEMARRARRADVL